MSRSDLLESFASFPAGLREAALAAEERPVQPGEWTPIEVIRHLIAVEDEVHQHRLRQVAADDVPHWQWTEPGLATGFDSARIVDVLDAFEGARASTVGTIRALSDEGWSRYGTHATYGRLDVEGLIRLASDHDAEHLEALRG